MQSAIFVASPARAPLREGELLAGVIQTLLSLGSLRAQQTVVNSVQHYWSVVLSQDCDLDWDYAWRFPKLGRPPLKAKELPNVLFCEARPVDGGVRLADFDSDIWRRIQQHQDVRYHLLPEVPPAGDRGRDGIPPLLIDFKRYFTVPTAEVYARCAMRSGNPERALRRAILETPYREDLSVRFFNYQSRIALPDDMAVQPGRPS